MEPLALWQGVILRYGVKQQVKKYGDCLRFV